MMEVGRIGKKWRQKKGDEKMKKIAEHYRVRNPKAEEVSKRQRVERALKKMDPEVRKITRKYLAKQRAIDNPTGADIRRLGREFADEMMERAMKKYHRKRPPSKFQRKCNNYFLRPPGGLYKLAQKRLREQKK